jgi:glutaredoxin
MGSLKYSVGSLGRVPQADRIVVYTSSGCPRCTMLKEWLKSREKEFEEKDIENVDVMADLVMRNAVVLSAPALEVEETVYREDEIFDGNGRINGELLHILEGK